MGAKTNGVPDVRRCRTMGAKTSGATGLRRCRATGVRTSGTMGVRRIAVRRGRVHPARSGARDARPRGVRSFVASSGALYGSARFTAPRARPLAQRTGPTEARRPGVTAGPSLESTA